MRFFHLVRSLRTGPRALLVGLMLAFGLDVVAHAAHQHDPAKAGSSLEVACGYCVSFGSLLATPTHDAYRALVAVDRFEHQLTTLADAAYRPRSSAQPRAPPLS